MAPKTLPRTNTDPSGLKEGGICDNHSLWSPVEGDNFHLFSTKRVTLSKECFRNTLDCVSSQELLNELKEVQAH